MRWAIWLHLSNERHKDMQAVLRQLCEKIEKEALQITSAINAGSTFCSTVFDNPIVIQKWHEQDRRLRGQKGIYVFIVRNALTLEYKQVFDWNETLKGAKFREYKKIDINDGDCLYIGSCVSKSLYSRIKEHFSDSGSYYALKLGHPARQELHNTVYCVAFPIKCNYTQQQYRILLPALEKRLHDLLVPLCGSNRV